MRRLPVAVAVAAALTLPDGGLQATSVGRPAAVGGRPHTPQNPEFDVASIKRNLSGDRGNSMQTLQDGTLQALGAATSTFNSVRKSMAAVVDARFRAP